MIGKKLFIPSLFAYCHIVNNILQYFSSEAPNDENCKPKGTESGPTDLRKTSWMNGFMMFSQMHRKDYIE